MRRRILRRTVVVPLVLLLSLLGPGAASASPLASANAYAYGLEVSLLNSQLISPIPEATAGPQPGTGSDDLITAPVQPLVFTGAVGAKARTTLESEIQPEIGNQYLRAVEGGPGLPAAYNAQGYARTDGLAVLAEEILPTDVVSSIIGEIGEEEVFPALVSADLIHSEALMSCVDGSRVLVGGGQAVGLGILGISLTDLVDGTVNQVVELGDTLVGTLLPGAQLVLNEVIRTTDGVSVNALRLTIPNVAEVIVAHSEISGNPTCAPLDLPECSDGIDNDGDGKIDFPADPGCTSPQDDDERDMVRTGGEGPGLGLAIFGAGGLLMLAAIRMRRSLFAGKS